MSDSKAKCDVIFVLGGQAARRVPYGVYLFKERYGDKLLITIGREDQWVCDATKKYGVKTYTQVLADAVMRKENVDMTKCVYLEDSLSTLSDAKKLREYFNRNKFKSAMVVTDPIHSRRSMLCIYWCFKDTGVRFLSCPIELKGFSDRFADYDDYINYVIEEFLRYTYYVLWLKKGLKFFVFTTL